MKLHGPHRDPKNQHGRNENHRGPQQPQKAEDAFEHGAKVKIQKSKVKKRFFNVDFSQVPVNRVLSVLHQQLISL
jgi:hypothetical protein